MDLKTIVVATDLSDACGAAAKWAQQLKERLGAERIIVEHVIELSLSSWATSAFEVLDDPAQRYRAEEKVNLWFEKHAGARPDEVVLRAGSCVAQIVDVISGLEGETMLVVSGSGKGAVTRFFLGSTAHALASQPPCPVAVVHVDHANLPSATPIVTGTDLSRNGKNAVAFAASLGRQLGVPVEVVHAYGPSPSPLVNLKSEIAEQTMVKVATRKIESQGGLDGADVRIRVLGLEPADAIIDHAKTLNSDLVVIGHSGETAFAYALGSIAQRVLNHTPCTMIVVPAIGYDDPVFRDDEEE